MKAWRKHNMACAANKTPGYRLTTKLERRTHFQAEVHLTPPLIIAMFKRVGLPVPMIQP